MHWEVLNQVIIGFKQLGGIQNIQICQCTDALIDPLQQKLTIIQNKKTVALRKEDFEKGIGKMHLFAEQLKMYCNIHCV